MRSFPSKPFSNGTEYEVFRYNYCERCKNHKVREDGFPAFVEDGGCPIEDAMEYARFDLSKFPNKKIREIRDEDDDITRYHHCIEFNKINWNLMTV